MLRQSAVPGRSCEVADQPIVVRSADQPTPAKLVGQVLALCAEVGPAAGDQCSTYRALRRPPLWPPSHAQPREEKVLIKVPPACRPSAARRRGTPSSHRRAGRRLRGEDAHQDPTGVQAGGGAENELTKVPPACRPDAARRRRSSRSHRRAGRMVHGEGQEGEDKDRVNRRAARGNSVMQMPFPTVGPRPWRLVCSQNRVPSIWASGMC